MTSRARSSHPSSASLPSSVLSAAIGTPASRSEAMIMSPAAPLTQSKYTTLMPSPYASTQHVQLPNPSAPKRTCRPTPIPRIRAKRPGAAQPPTRSLRSSCRRGPGGAGRGLGTRSLQPSPDAAEPRWSPAEEGKRTQAAWSRGPSRRPPAPAGTKSANLCNEAIDLAGLMRRAVAVVDVHHRHARRARVQHRQKRRHAAERSPVADARRHRDDGSIDEPADHARQRPLHAGKRNDHVGLGEQIEVIQEPVQSRDAAVVDSLHAISERLGDERRFLSDGEIGGARGGDDDEPALLAWLRPDDQEPRLRVIDVRQPAELADRAVDVDASGLQVFEERPDRFSIHRSLAGGA